MSMVEHWVKYEMEQKGKECPPLGKGLNTLSNKIFK